MLTCPICGAAIDENTRVCPACREKLAERSDSAPAKPTASWFTLRELLVIIAIVMVVLALVLPETKIATSGGRREASAHNLKNLALAIHKYHEAHDCVPVAQVEIDASAATHGWQTRVLPYLDEAATHRAIDVDVPWDDPANTERARMRINLYLNPQVPDLTDARGYPLIHYAGNVHVLERVPPLAFSDITDGTSHTILIGEVTEGLRAWGEPGNVRDPALGLNRGPTMFGSAWKDGGVQFVAADGAVRWVAGDTPLDVLEALATPAGGERVSFPEY